MTNRDVKGYIFGAGGLAREIRWIAEGSANAAAISSPEAFVVSNDSEELALGVVDGIPVIDEATFLLRCHSEPNQRIQVVLGMASPKIKRKVIELISALSQVEFPSVIHASAVLFGPKLGKGVVVGPLVHLSTKCYVGDFAYIGPQTGIGHDTTVGSYSSILWQAAIAGNVQIASEVLIGSKAAVKQGSSIGDHSVVGMGAVVLGSVLPEMIVVGNPAKPIERSTGDHE